METVFKGRARARVSLIHFFVRRFAVAAAAIFLLQTDGRHAHVDPAPGEILGGADVVDTLAQRPNVDGYLDHQINCLFSYCI
jgi:mannan endo-1,4-beta-mannosidase